MANEKRSISRYTDEATDKNGKGGWFFAIEEPNDLGNPTTYKMSLDVLKEGFLSPDELGNTSFGGFNATDVNIFTVNTIQSYDTGKVSFDSPTESTITDKHRLLPFAYYKQTTPVLVGAGVKLLDISRLQDSIVFSDLSNTARIQNGKLRAIQIIIDADFDNNCSLDIVGSSYNEGTTTTTPISTKKVYVSNTANTGIINGTFAVDFTSGVLSGEDLLIDVQVPEAVTGSFSITVQGLQ